MRTEESVTHRVLVVDDDAIDRRAVCRALSGRFLVIEAEDGEQAIRSLEADNPACILLDYNIPGTDTLKLLDAFRQRVPVVMLTGQGDEAVAVAAMKGGAGDYLSKNDFSASRLIWAIHRSIEKMDRQRRQSESRKRLRSEYRLEKERRQELEASLAIARDIQQNLIPSVPPDLEGFDIRGVYLPAEWTGGDFFDYVPMCDGALAVVIVDVVGHGIGPALLATETRACIRALVRTSSDVGNIATIVNKLLTEDVPEGCFATLFLAKVDPADQTLTYAAAGHCAYIIHASGEFTALDSQVPPLGVMEAHGVTSSEPIKLRRGDILMLATDGLFETRSPAKKMLGIERCINIVREHRRSPAEKILDELLHEMHAFTQDEPPQDDVTIVIAKMK